MRHRNKGGLYAMTCFSTHNHLTGDARLDYLIACRATKLGMHWWHAHPVCEANKPDHKSIVETTAQGQTERIVALWDGQTVHILFKRDNQLLDQFEFIQPTALDNSQQK
jgi:hypothetical protein